MNADQATQAELLDLLKTNSLQSQAQACQRLAIIGDKTAIPVLASLLDDERLGDYARTALEIFEAPEAGAALRKALTELKGSALAGVVDSLAIRRDREAVPALIALANDPQRGPESGALTALGRIATPEAVAAIVAALPAANGAKRHPVWHASLLAASQLLREDQARAAGLLDALLAANPPRHVARAANALRQQVKA